ncbi:MAG: SIS domain-containing protein [Acidobacteriota bacterium]
MLSATNYISALQDLLEKIKVKQIDAIRQAGILVADALQAGGIIQAFGSGHSHMVAEEAFYRAGGIVPVNPILDPRLLFLDGALESTIAERQSGYAHAILEREEVTSKDVAILISNSGRNAVSIEMALELRSKGLKLIAITNVHQSRQSAARHASGKRLFELVDVVIDNCVPVGDAALPLPGQDAKQHIGPTSTVAGAAIMNSILIEAASEMLRRHLPVPILPSANVDTSEEGTLERLLERYSNRIRYFRREGK